MVLPEGGMGAASGLHKELRKGAVSEGRDMRTILMQPVSLGDGLCAHGVQLLKYRVLYTEFSFHPQLCLNLSAGHLKSRGPQQGAD